MDVLNRAYQYALGVIKMAGIADVIDIAIIAYAIYRFMLLVRRTSAARVAKAVLIILGAVWASGLLHLNVVSFILSRAVEIGFVALVIVFQPEVRKFLEQIGGSSPIRGVFNSPAPVSEVSSAIAQTVAACTQLSRDKVGALIVFERKNLLDDIVQTGTVLDAAVSAEILKNIFWPNAPMHDGAVILRAGRVAGAGCMLPLSGNANLSRDLGMRHRAGIGMSERSDAVVAVVSEESGSISVAVGGMLKRHLAPETLERLLRIELLADEEPSAPKGIFALLFRSKKGAVDDGKD